MEDWSIHLQRDPIERAGTPFQVWASWLDGGTSSGAVHRFMSWRNPQRIMIGAWSHGGRRNANPYLLADAPLDPDRENLVLEDICFFDRYLKGIENGITDRRLIYYTLGEDKWKSTVAWPPAGSVRRHWYFREAGKLSTDAPTTASGEDPYVVDFAATTGTANRWRTQLGGADVVYPDRAEEDRRLLTYTTPPLADDVEITGEPVVKLYLSSTATDGAFFVYLEDIDPTGRVTYITEGILRAMHRKVAAGGPPYRSEAPYHSFKRKDALPLVPGVVTELHFGLIPTSVLIRAGHRVRVAIAGADKDTFARIPETGTPTIRMMRNRTYASFIDLPVMPR
jgi:putative CocE/NonD family hydrolase